VIIQECLSQNLDSIIHKYSSILFDIDGTLMAGGEALPNAINLINELRKRDFPFLLLTNDGDHSLEEKSELLNRCGFNFTPNEIISCASVINQYVEKNELRDVPFFVLGKLGTPCFAELAGLNVVRDISKIDACKGFIVGEGDYNWQQTIEAVLKSLMVNNSRPFLVPNPDSYWPKGSGVGIGAGGIARFMETILAEMKIDLDITYLGKPYSGIYDYTLSILKERHVLGDELTHHNVLVIGDSIESDIYGANQYGMDSCLVLTGIGHLKMLENGPKLKYPTMVYKTL
jgi:HAD superfamily hydrolase (TIGR01450 family)